MTKDITRALLEIFKYLSTGTIAIVISCVSKKWKRTATINELWTFLLYRDSGHDHGYYASPFSDSKLAYCLALHQCENIVGLTSFPCTSFLVVNPNSMKGRQVSTGQVLLEKNPSWCYLPIGGVLVTGGNMHGVMSRKSFMLVGALLSVVESGNMTEAREGHSLCRVDYTVFAFGGKVSTRELATCEKFQIRTQQWEPIASLPVPLSHICSTYMKGKDIYLLHFSLPSRFLRFRLPAETFEPVTILMFSSFEPVAMLAFNTDLVIIGKEFGVRCDMKTMTEKHRFNVLTTHLVYGVSWVQIGNKAYSPLTGDLILEVDLSRCAVNVKIPLR